MKYCPICKQNKSEIDFYRNKSRTDGLSGSCKDCSRKASLAWKQNHKDQHLEYCRTWYEENKERSLMTSKRWRMGHKNQHSQLTREWSKNNLDKRSHNEAKRRQRGNTIKFGQSGIAEFYRNCPEGYEVDHIIPLQGKLVSGLHVSWNLQYLTKEENQRKHNKFVIG